MYSTLIQDPLVWITEVRRTPDLSDLLYAFTILPWFFKFGLIIALLPLIGGVTWLVDTYVVPVLLPIWKLDYSVVVVFWNQFLYPVISNLLLIVCTNPTVYIITPLLWSIFTYVGARELRSVTHPRLDGPARHGMTRSEYRRHRQEMRRRSCLRTPSQSIRTAGLHRKYPLHLRSAGHFVRRSQAPTVEERQFRDEIYKIQI